MGNPGEEQTGGQQEQAPMPGERTGRQQRQTRQDRPARSQQVNKDHSKATRAGVGAGAAGAAGALMAAATGGSPVAMHESLMPLATEMAMGAGIALPPALMVTFLYRQSTGKTTNLEKASQAWAAAAKDLGDAAQQLQQLVKEIPGEAWTMDDRPLYESKVTDFSQQLESLGDYCTAAQISIMVVAWALLVYSVFAVGMGLYLDILASAAALALSTGAGATLYPEFLALAQTAFMVTGVATGILAMAGTGAAAVLGGGALLTANAQENNGAEAFAALKKAVVTGAAGTAANMAENAANSGLNLLNRAGRGTVPTGQIDLDADRAIDKTWNVGLGGKVISPGGMVEAGGAYHMEYRDGDVQKQTVEADGKVSGIGGVLNVAGGGKLEWDEHENLENKSFKVTGEGPVAGAKAEYEGNFDGNNEYTDKYSVNSPVFNDKGNFAGKKAEDPPPPWDQNL